MSDLEGSVLDVQSGVSKGSVEETCLLQQAEVWELVSVLYSHIGQETPLARRLEGMLLLLILSPSLSLSAPHNYLL